MNHFRHFTGDNREHRLIRETTGPDFQNQVPGMPGYDQLIFENRAMAKKLQEYDRLMLEGDITPRDAQDRTAKQALSAQQLLWNNMGGQFMMGASPPQFYVNIGSRARYWNRQMQRRQYNPQPGGNPNVQTAPQQTQAPAPQPVSDELPPQPEYLNGLGRNPNAEPPLPVFLPVAPSIVVPFPPRPEPRFRRPSRRGPRIVSNEPQLYPGIVFDQEGNPRVVYPDNFTAASEPVGFDPNYRQTMSSQISRGIIPSVGPGRGGERFGKLSTERQRGPDSRREDMRKVVGMLRAMSQFLSPEEQRIVETMISSFEQLINSVDRMQSAAERGNLKEAQAHAQDVQTRLRGLWTILPQDIRKVAGEVLRKQGMLTGTESIGGNFELVWNIDNDFNAPTIQVRSRAGGGNVGGRGNTNINYTSAAGEKQRYEGNLKNGTDAGRKQETAKTNADERNKTAAETKTSEEVIKLTEDLKKLREDRTVSEKTFKESQRKLAESETKAKEALAKLSKHRQEFEASNTKSDAERADLRRRMEEARGTDPELFINLATQFSEFDKQQQEAATQFKTLADQYSTFYDGLQKTIKNLSSDTVEIEKRQKDFDQRINDLQQRFKKMQNSGR